MHFIVGMGAFGLGVFLIFQNTMIFTSFSLMDVVGFSPPFGVVLLPLLIGIGVLFFSEKSLLGWGLVIFGMLSILAGILLGLKIFFKPVPLYEAVLMYGMTAAGIGLMVRAFRSKRSS